ncbi:HNH endonuclease, partial [Pseudomonas syringae pv. actinidiae]|nr:HNH endonuclease [Pseudomonas syringae pv. actinidiae]
MGLKAIKPRLKEVEGRQLKAINPESWRSGKTTAAQRGYGYKCADSTVI